MLQVLPEQVNTEVESDPLRPARPVTWSKNKNTPGVRILQRSLLKSEHRNLPERCRHDNRTGNTPADLHPFVSNVQFLYSCTFPPVRVSCCLGEGAVSSVCVGSRAPGSGASGVPGPLYVLALQEPLQLFELCHRPILHVGI